MFGQHLVLAAVGVAALSLGGASAVSAERGGPSHGDEDTAAITATALTPESICASPGTAPGVAQLCTLWSAHTLPERAQQMI